MPLKFRNLFEEDTDVVFSFKTIIEVIILDRYVGIPFRLMQICLLFYMIFSNIFIQNSIFNYEYSKGTTLIQLAGSGLLTNDAQNNQSFYYDGSEIAYFDSGSQTLFLTSKILISSQIKGNCTDSNFRCKNNEDCLGSKSCIDGSCEVNKWCAQIDKKPTTLKYEINENILIWFRSFIKFPELDQKNDYSTFYENEPKITENNKNVYSLKQIFDFSEEIIDLKTLEELGGIFQINVLWSCYYNEECIPTIKIKKINQLKKSIIKYDYKTDEKNTRLYYEVTGLKLIFQTEGIIYKISAGNIIFQIANLFALMLIPNILADFLLIYFLRYQDYRSYKYEKISNLNELQDENIEIPAIKNRDEEIIIKKNEEVSDSSLSSP